MVSHAFFQQHLKDRDLHGSERPIGTNEIYIEFWVPYFHLNWWTVTSSSIWNPCIAVFISVIEELDGV